MVSPAPYPLQRKWSLWEMWDQGKKGEYKNNLRRVGEFDSLHSFWQHWNHLPHGDPASLFYHPSENIYKHMEGINRPIDAVAVFVSGVEPSWEDSVNNLGSDLAVRKPFAFPKLKDFWSNLVFALIGETFPYAEEVVGARVVDKGKGLYKFEVWLTFDVTSPEQVQKGRELTRFVAREILEGAALETEIVGSAHKAKAEGQK